ncbi:unnamed protein product, partial [marine sediment metagenome]
AEFLRLKETPAPAAPAAPTAEEDDPPGPQPVDDPTDGPPPPIDATEGARNLAANRGIELTRVAGTGANGRITVKDVRAEIAIDVDGDLNPE